MNDTTTNNEIDESNNVIDLSKHSNENYNQILGTQGKISSIKVDKPTKDDWFMCGPEDDFAINLYLAEAPVVGSLKKKSYLVNGASEATHQELLSTLTSVRFCKCVMYCTSTGVYGIWPLKLFEGAGEQTDYHTSILEAHQDSQQGFIKMKWRGGRYEWISPRTPEIFKEPIFPAEQTMVEILNIAFRDSVITDMEHPVVMKADGRA